MTSTRTRDPERDMKLDLRRHVLALVLFAVLVCYTIVSPSYTPAPLRAADCDSPDAEEREAEAGAGTGLPSLELARPAAQAADAFNVGHGADGVDMHELDWPEIIGGD